MSTNHHTAISNGAAANAATFNAPLSQLDTKISSQETAILLRSIVWAGKTTAPTANDDTGDGIKVGDRWIDETNNQEYVAVDVTLGAAIWQQTTKTTAVTTMINGLQLIWNSDTSITVGIGSCYAENGNYIDVTSALVKSALSLTSSTWYHVYVYLSGGTPTAEVVTTAPVAWKSSAFSKTGDTSRRYVGSLRTDGSGNVWNFTHFNHANLMFYKTNTNRTPFMVLSGGTATTFTNVDCSGVIPSTSVLCLFNFANGATNGYIVLITSDDGYSHGSGATTDGIINVGPSANTVSSFPLNTSQVIQYRYTASPTPLGGWIYVLGYYFAR